MKWETKRVGDVCQILNGGTPKTGVKDYWDGDIAWITPKDMGKLEDVYVSRTERRITQAGVQNSSAKLLPPGSIILSTRAPIGHLAINEVPMTTNQGCKGLVLNDKVNNKYLYYYLKSNVELLDSLGSGTTFKELAGSKLADVPLPLPPLPEQQRIVTKLDAAFAALAEAQAHVERNRANARELFESYLNGVFEGKEGWETSPLAELTEFFSDGDWIESKDQSPEGIRLVQTGNIGVGEYKDKADKARFISEATFHRLRCTDVLPGDCLISRLPEPVGRGCIIPYLGTRMITGVDCSIVRFDRTKVLPEFFVYFSQTRDYMAEVNALVTGTTRSRISRSNLGRITVRYPSTKEQLNILSELDRLKAQIDALEATYQKKLLELEGLKKGLLGAAFRGEL